MPRVTLFPFLALLAVSCDAPREAEPASGESRPPPGHPWDWVPEDPALLAGRESYLAECALCHNEGEEGAPPLTRRSEWETRAAKGESTLVTHAIEGFIGEDGEMPARGDSNLTDQQIADAVRYMLAASRGQSPPN